MSTLISPAGIKIFSRLHIQMPKRPLRLGHVAASIKEAGLRYQVIDAIGEALSIERPYPGCNDSTRQGLSLDAITARIHPDAEDTRYAKWSEDCFYTRCRWLMPAETARR